MAGGNLTLNCLASSPSKQPGLVSYHWYFDGRPVTSGLRPNVTADGNVLMVTGKVVGSVQCFAVSRAGAMSAIVVLGKFGINCSDEKNYSG